MVNERFRILKIYLTQYWNNGENSSIDPQEYPGHEFFVEIEGDGLHRFIVLTEQEAKKNYEDWVDTVITSNGIRWFLEPFYETEDSDIAEEFETGLCRCITDDYMKELGEKYNFSESVTTDQLEKIFGSIPSLVQNAMRDGGIDYARFYDTIEEYYGLGYAVDSIDFEYGQCGEYFIFEVE